MNEMNIGSRWNANALRHSTSELWVMVTMAADKGIDAERCMAGTLLDLQTLCQRRSRISFAQQLEILRRINQLVTDRLWLAQVGSRLHLTSYGMIGYALLSSQTLENALELANRYAPLLNLKHELKISVDGNIAKLRLEGGYMLAEDMRETCELIEVAKITNLLRGMLGISFQALEIRLAQNLDENLTSFLRAHAGCIVKSETASTEIHFDASLLNSPLPQAEPLTCANCVEVCQHQLEESLKFDMTSGRVRALLERCLDSLPGMAQVARELCMSPRSLRRRLETEGTSFNEIVESIRRDAAERLLTTTRMSAESIADLLGYCDAANFRHAFKRWTGKSTREFRQHCGSTDHIDTMPAAVLLHSSTRSARSTLSNPYI